MKMRALFLLLAALIWVSLAEASSYEERRNLCLDGAAGPRSGNESLSEAQTEADAACLECLAKAPLSKEIIEIKKEASSIEEKARGKRDLKFFRLVMSTSVDSTLESISQMQEQTTMWKNNLAFNRSTGVIHSSEEASLILKMQDLFLKSFSSEKSKSATALKELLGQQEAMRALIDSKLKLLLELEEKMKTAPFVSKVREQIKTVTSFKDKFDAFMKKIGSGSKISEKEGVQLYDESYPSFPKYDPGAIEDSISKMEKKIQDQESEKKNFSTATDEEALRLYETKVFSSLKGKIEQNLCGLSAAEAWAIRNYTSSGYEELNKGLRSGGEVSEKNQVYREVLNSALAKLKPFVGTVTRGTYFLPPSLLEQYQPGAVILYAAFTSTSKGKFFGGDQKFIIKSKSGRYVNPISVHEGEDEVIFPTGKKFKVLDVHMREEIKPGDPDFVKTMKRSNVDITMEEVD